MTPLLSMRQRRLEGDSMCTSRLQSLEQRCFVNTRCRHVKALRVEPCPHARKLEPTLRIVSQMQKIHKQIQSSEGVGGSVGLQAYINKVIQNRSVIIALWFHQRIRARSSLREQRTVFNLHPAAALEALRREQRSAPQSVIGFSNVHLHTE